MLKFVTYTVHKEQSMSRCSVHVVYHKPTLCESLARAKILQSECKYPETKYQVVKRLHVLLRSTLAAICLRLLAISCGGLVAICTIGHKTRQNVSCYNSSAGNHVWLRRFWILEVRNLGEICQKFQWQKRSLSKLETNRSLKCLHGMMLETRLIH